MSSCSSSFFRKSETPSPCRFAVAAMACLRHSHGIGEWGAPRPYARASRQPLGDPTGGRYSPCRKQRTVDFGFQKLLFPPAFCWRGIAPRPPLPLTVYGESHSHEDRAVAAGGWPHAASRPAEAGQPCCVSAYAW
jgi:hypothetical protein